MRFSLVAAATLPLLASAADHLVTVGAGGLLAFSPPNITAAQGDTVSFQFQSKNHSVTQSTFANPCSIQTAPGQGIDSGFQFVSPNATEFPQWTITVQNTSSPLWFYCAQTIPKNHCETGMVFSVNAVDTSPKSFAVYQANAIALGVAASVTSAAAGAASTVASDVNSVVNAATSVAGAAAGAVTSAVGGAIGAATSDIGSALTAVFGGNSPQSTGNSTGAAFSVSASPIHFLAAFGVAAGLLL